MQLEFPIGSRVLGPNGSPYVVAEIGVNHNGDLALAERSIDAAAESGADAVKFQTFHADEFMADREVVYAYESAGRRREESMYAMFKRLELPARWHAALQERAQQRHVDFLSSAADRDAVDLLVSLGVPALKLASEDLINLPLLRYVAGHDVPVILSTGMADAEEIDQAVEILRGGRCPELLLLHCVSLYPTPDAEANLLRIATLREHYRLPVGYSDHTQGIEAAVGAAALGAVFIEKHFTLDRSLPGPDHALSADPEEFGRMIASVRRVAGQRGDGHLRPGAEETAARDGFRRSVVAAVDIPSGTTITDEMLCLKRPGTGLPPRAAAELIGRRTLADLARDQQLAMKDVA
jgi:N-acetylneuraminate synthase/N,N'-diacetyllegionaminate synthase